MTGYVRVDTSNNIADGNVISAADLDNEFDGIQAAFNASTGHNHDGTTGEGAPISVLGPTQDVVVGASTVTPKTTNTVDIGSSSLKFKDLYLAGNASIGGTLAVTGATTLSSALTYGGVTLSNAVTGTGNMVLSASPTFTGTLAAAAANFSGNVTLGDASTDTVTVNGYMGVGGAGNPGRGIQVVSTALTGGDQIGVYSNATASSSATTALRSFYSVPKTAIAAFTCANIYGFSADDASLGAGSSVTNLVGVQIADQTQGTNNYGLRSLVSSGTNKWNIYASGTAQNYFAGNVGIGTTAFANSTLRVSTTDGTYPLGVSGTTKGLRIVTSATDVRLDAVDNTLAASYEPLYLNGSIVKFGTSLTERMRLDSTGLGIGTSSPTNALSVTGSANITGNTTLGDATTDTVTVNGYMGVGGVGGSSTGLWVRNNALTGTNQNGILASPVGTTSGTSVAAIVTSPGTAASVYTATALYGMYVGDAVKGAGSTITTQNGITIADQTQGVSNIGLTSQVSSGSGKWNIYASGTAQNYFAGNVGIGTTSPAYKLDVSGSANAVSQQWQVSGSNFRLRLKSGTAATANSSQYRLYLDYLDGTNTNSYLDFYRGSAGNDGYLVFGTAGSDRMTLDASGNLGIGTSSPQAKLEVGGAGQLYINQDQRLEWNIAGSTIIRANIRGTSGNALVFGNRVGGTLTDTMTLDGSGNLGLGVTPSAWASSVRALEMTTGAFYSYASGSVSNFYNLTNAYLNSAGNPIYKQSSFASQYLQTAGQHQWFTAPSGTAGNAISFTQAMTLFASGGFAIGSTIDPGAGNIRFESQKWTGIDTNARYVADDASVGGALYTGGGFRFFTGGANERMRIDSSGNLALGATSASYRLDITAAAATNGVIAVRAAANQNSSLSLAGNASTPLSGSFDLIQDQTQAYVYQRANNPLVFGTNNTERARIDSSGNLLVGTTSTYGGPGRINVGFNQSTNFGLTFRNTSATATGVFVSFENSAGGGNGSISQTNSTTVAYNTSSDRRLKKDIAPAPQAGADIDAIQVVSHGWVSNDDTVKYGLIAQDLNTVAPQAVSAGDDGQDIERTWGVDYSKLVPMLIKEVQALRTRVAALESI